MMLEFWNYCLSFSSAFFCPFQNECCPTFCKINKNKKNIWDISSVKRNSIHYNQIFCRFKIDFFDIFESLTIMHFLQRRSEIIMSRITHCQMLANSHSVNDLNWTSGNCKFSCICNILLFCKWPCVFRCSFKN